MRYLFFDDKKICYDSPQFFISAMVRELTALGHECRVCRLTERPDLEALTKTEFDGIFGFNSRLPQLRLGEDDYYADHLQGPFYNWLLDHPLYHHPSLVSGAKNQHVLTLDEKHAAYLKRYYPHLASAETRPLFAMPFEEARIRPLEERPLFLLFTGTYTSREMLDRRMADLPEDARRDILELTDLMEADRKLSAEEALEVFIERRKASVSDQIFREFLWRYYLADTAVAAHTREAVIRALLEAGIKVNVCGHGWEKLSCKGKENLVLLGERSYGESLELAYDARILLNIMPNFKAGLHDRVLTAMGHGAVSLTDQTTYLDRYFSPGRSHLSYCIDRAGIEELVETVKEAEAGRLDLQALADCGFGYAKKRTVSAAIKNLPR